MTLHEHIATVAIVAVLGTFSLWITVFEDASWIAGKLVPFVALTVGLLQLYILLFRKIRKH